MRNLIVNIFGTLIAVLSLIAGIYNAFFAEKTKDTFVSYIFIAIGILFLVVFVWRGLIKKEE